VAVAVIVAVVVEVTDVVLTVNEALVAPAATVTLPGTVAELLLLESVNTAPPEGAAAVRVTVPLELAPPTTVVGFRVSVEITGPQELLEFTVRLLDGLTPPDSAKIGTVWLVVVHIVPTEKLRLVLPAGTVTVTYPDGQRKAAFAGKRRGPR
jgi:hypothetical protein